MAALKSIAFLPRAWPGIKVEYSQVELTYSVRAGMGPWSPGFGGNPPEPAYRPDYERSVKAVFCLLDRFQA